MPEAELPIVIGQLGERLEVAFFRATREERLTQTPAAAPRSRRRPAFAIVFAAIALVAIALTVLGVRVGGNDIGVRDALGDVAQRIDVAPQPGPTQFLYTRSRSTYTGLQRAGLDYRGRPHDQFVSSRPHYQSSWLSISRNGRLLMRGGPPIYPTAKDAAIGKRFEESLTWFQSKPKTRGERRERSKVWWKIAHWNEAHGMGIGVGFPESYGTERGTMVSNDRLVLGGEMLTRKQVKRYPRDPQAIYRRVQANFAKQVRADAKFNAKLAPANRTAKGENPDVDESVWGSLSGSSGDLPAPQDLRSAVVRALAYLPGVKAAGVAKDVRGRPGELFTWDHKGKRYSVIFDADTSVVLSSRTVVIDPAALEFSALRHLPAGTELSSYTLLEQKTIDKLPRRR